MSNEFNQNNSPDKNIIDSALKGAENVGRAKRLKDAWNAYKASKAAAATAGAGATVFSVAITIIAFIVIMILLTGLIVAIIYLPGSIVHKAKNFFQKAFIAVRNYFSDERAQVSDETYANIANYLIGRGYDLYGEGYINDDFEEKHFNEEGLVTKLPDSAWSNPHLLELYAQMDAYTYRVRNKSGIRFWAKNEWAGMLNFELGDEGDKFKQGFVREKIKVRREEGVLEVQKNLFGDKYHFQLDGWTGRYGLPMELQLALHQGTRAPDLVREISNGTRVYYNGSDSEEGLEKGEEVFKYIENSEDLIYEKPVVNIKLFDMKIDGKILFHVPTSTTINGTVYVMQNFPEYGEEYDEPPVLDFSDSNMVAKSSVTAEEMFKAFFRTADGRYIRIKPKKPSNKVSLKYDGVMYANRDTFGVPMQEEIYKEKKIKKPNPKFMITEIGDILTPNEPMFLTETKYVMVEHEYDFSKLYFEGSGPYTVRNIAGLVIDGPKESNNIEFIDEYGMYAAVSEILAANSTIDPANYFGVVARFKKAFGLGQTIETYLPIIKNSENHWFRDVYFEMEAGQKFVKEDKDYFLTTGEKWTKYDISEEEGKKVLTAQTDSLSKPWTAYDVKVNNIESSPKKLNTGKDEYKGIEDHVYVVQTESVIVNQKEEARRGMTNMRTKNLFSDHKWYRYDGLKSSADAIKADRELAEGSRNPTLKSSIDTDDDLVVAFEMLEGSKSLDAQYILRDLKELYVELGYFKKEDLRDPIRRVLKWPLAGYATPKMWPAADIHQDPEAYGVYIPSKKTLEEIYDEETLEENVEVLGTGFEEDVSVVSPVTGKIVDKGKKDVVRTVIDEEGNQKKVEYKNVDYITIEAIDSTAPDEVAEYKPFYDTEYKGVISGKLKHGKAKGSRYLTGNKITIEGLNIEFPENINDKENSKYLRQLKKSTISRIEDKKTREEAEKLEKSKVDAPNYISLSGGIGEIGDYIKEGTIIGKTTDSDIKITMQDADKAFVENVDHYIVLETKSRLSTEGDYYTRVEPGEDNVITDLALLKRILSAYPILQENAQAILDVQEEYQINALFVAAVAIQECSGGNATSGVNHGIGQAHGLPKNNIFSMSYGCSSESLYPPYNMSTGVGQPSNWHIYPDYATSIKEFAIYITKPDGLYWADNHMFVSEIGDIYCRGGDWANGVNTHMTNLLKQAMEE